MFEFKGWVVDFIYYMTLVAEMSREGVKETIRNPSLVLSPPPPFFLSKNLIPANLKSVVLVSHAFGGVHIHLMEFWLASCDCLI